MYTFTTKLLHALSAALIVMLLPLGYIITKLDYYSPWYQILPNLHYILGLLFALLLLSRVTNIILYNKDVDYKEPLVRIGHCMLYIFMFTAVISGYILASDDLFFFPSVYNMFSIDEAQLHDLHRLSTYGLLVLITGHITMALWHQFVKKDALLKKMFGK